MNVFNYALIRFIPDSERMEPINIGLLLQGQGEVDFKLSPHAAKRKEIDTQVFQQWRRFFEQEVRGPAVPLFQPPKGSSDFIRHLSNVCEGAVRITKPLVHMATTQASFQGVLEEMYERLVAPPELVRRQPERPTSFFRQIEEEKDFRRRGMKKHPYIPSVGGQYWNAFRQVLNGQEIVIDKIEVGNSVGLTADEIQKIASGSEHFVKTFLGSRGDAGRLRRYCLIADKLTGRFSDQTDDDFDIMQEQLETAKDVVKRSGGEVLSTTDDITGFAEELDRKLPGLAYTG
jgi:hypothetical protein